MEILNIFTTKTDTPRKWRRVSYTATTVSSLICKTRTSIGKFYLKLIKDEGNGNNQ